MIKITSSRILSIFLIGLAALILPASGWYYICSGLLIYRAFQIWGD